jgi:osmoprotectant transport system ATP-binding protein
MLNLDNLTVSFQGKPVLDRINLKLEAGRTTALIGPSGCGKSTLLRTVVGLVAPEGGCVEFDGTELCPANIFESRHRMGYVIQDGGLFPHLTVRVNVSIAARSLHRDREAILKRIEELRYLVQLPSDLMERYPAQLSGGQRQRVCLMRALMLDPDLLLLDEPLAALDPMIRAEMQTDLRDIFRSLGKTVLMVTHDMGEALYFGDRIVLMRNGRIVQNGEPDDLLRHPADLFVTRFIQAQRNPLERQSTI